MGSTEISKNRHFRVRVLSRPDSLHAPYLEKFAAMNSARYTEAEAGAGFKSLADAWADTTTPHGKLMLTVLGGLAEFERSLILARTSDGRTRAKPTSVRKRSSGLLRAKRRRILLGPTTSAM
jgi:DNA invertase Pin-like site-specific DNA recombinase